MQTAARVILHGDDLGMNPAVNQGIIAGFRQGLLTGASILANAPAVADALTLWRHLVADHQAGALPSAAVRRRLDDPPDPFDLGVHLNLTQGRPLTAPYYPDELLDDRGRFPGVLRLYGRLLFDAGKLRAGIEAELHAQCQFLFDHGLRPTHLNGHQYVELLPGIRELIPGLAQRFGIRVIRLPAERALWRLTGVARPGRWFLACLKRFYAQRLRARLEGLPISFPDAYFGTAHAGRIDRHVMERFLALGSSYRTIEVGMHPGVSSPPAHAVAAGEGWHDPLGQLRANELKLLVSDDLPSLLVARRLRLGRLSHLAQAKSGDGPRRARAA